MFQLFLIITAPTSCMRIIPCHWVCGIQLDKKVSHSSFTRVVDSLQSKFLVHLELIDNLLLTTAMSKYQMKYVNLTKSSVD